MAFAWNKKDIVTAEMVILWLVRDTICDVYVRNQMDACMHAWVSERMDGCMHTFMHE